MLETLQHKLWGENRETNKSYIHNRLDFFWFDKNNFAKKINKKRRRERISIQFSLFL